MGNDGQLRRKSVKYGYFPILSKGIVSMAISLLTTSTLKANTIACDNSDPVPALVQVAKELHAQFGAVRFQRDENWEDRFIVRWSEQVFAGRPHVFKVQPRRFDASKQPVTERLSGDLPSMYVATSSNGSKVYKLAGFDSPEQDFNRMVLESPSQEIRTMREAESRGLLCAEIVYDLSSNLWVDGPSSIQIKAAEHFFNEGHPDALRRTEKWWKKFNNQPREIRISTTGNDAGGFVLNLPVFWAPVETHSAPQIKLYHLRIGKEGTCHLDEPAILK